MLGGSIGVGVAYPLDTLKTKTQSMQQGADSNAFSLAAQIVHEDGIGGFYSGVSSTMVGQALIKGVTFGVYEGAKGVLVDDMLLASVGLVVAACISGAVGSFVVTPVERIKCVMQARDSDAYSSPLACINEVVSSDGIDGLMFRGLGATLLREIPAYAFYFVSYDLAKAAMSDTVIPEALIPLIGGAIAGAMAWVPVYPIDVVKTNIQVSDGADGDGLSMKETAIRLYDEGGFFAFWDGLTPKLARAVVNHAVTFFVFDQVCSAYGH